MGTIEAWFDQYGYLLLFFGLLLEYIALPFPGELTMGYAGYLSYQGELNWMLCVAVSFAGTSLGMTFGYGVGRLVGKTFFEKLPFTRKYMAKTSDWFEKYGTKLLFVSYYVPGVRHFTGYFAGVVRTPYRKFALYAYSGALVWALSFILLGKLLGPGWERMLELVEHYMVEAAVAAVVFVAAFWLLQRKFKWSKATFVSAAFKVAGAVASRFAALASVTLLATVIISALFLSQRLE